jgi:hypothetical protein
MGTPRQGIRIPFPLDTALFLVELAEEVGDLGPGEADTVEAARAQIDRIVSAHRSDLEGRGWVQPGRGTGGP